MERDIPNSRVSMAGVKHQNEILLDSRFEDYELDPDDDPSDYKQYKTSRRRQLIFKVALGVAVLILVVTTIVYFAHIRKKSSKHDDGILKDCANDGQTISKFKLLSGKCFQNRVVNTQITVSFYDKLDKCMSQCLNWPTCYSIDFYGIDGECFMFSVTSEEDPEEFVDTRSARHGIESVDDKRLDTCRHFDRVCR